MGKWTQRLDGINRPSHPDTAESPTDTTVKSIEGIGFVGFVGEPPTHFDAEIAWRLAIFRERIPETGPIFPPRLRNTPRCDTPGHCGLCGDALLPDRRYHCAVCVRALELALNRQREDIDALATPRQAGAA